MVPLEIPPLFCLQELYFNKFRTGRQFEKEPNRPFRVNGRVYPTKSLFAGALAGHRTHYEGAVWLASGSEPEPTLHSLPKRGSVAL